MNLIAKARKIRLLILDVDGVLTDGRLYFDSQGECLKAFHVHDGLGIKRLRAAGIETAIITARESQPVALRAEQLGIIHLFQAQHDKLAAYEELKTLLLLQDENIAYCGDDLPDLEPLQKVGLSIAPQNAVPAIKAIVDWVTPLAGGEGAVREIADFILKAQAS